MVESEVIKKAASELNSLNDLKELDKWKEVNLNRDDLTPTVRKIFLGALIPSAEYNIKDKMGIATETDLEETDRVMNDFIEEMNK